MSKRYPFIRVVLLICLLLYLLLAHCKTSHENLIPLFFKGNSGAETCTENSIDTFANVSPDGKWLFFVSGRNGNVVIYWVDAKVMNKLKTKDLKEERFIMKKIKIGILTCSATTKVLDCPVGVCLKDMYDRKGAFAEDRDQDIELAGIISCNGCPTIGGEEIILPKIEVLVHYGANRIHLAYCMMVLCPFVKKYVKVIKEKFQSLNLVEGTHESHQTDDTFRCDVATLLKKRKKTIIP